MQSTQRIDAAVEANAAFGRRGRPDDPLRQRIIGRPALQCSPSALRQHDMRGWSGQRHTLDAPRAVAPMPGNPHIAADHAPPAHKLGQILQVCLDVARAGRATRSASTAHRRRQRSTRRARGCGLYDSIQMSERWRVRRTHRRQVDERNPLHMSPAPPLANRRRSGPPGGSRFPAGRIKGTLGRAPVPSARFCYDAQVNPHMRRPS